MKITSGEVKDALHDKIRQIHEESSELEQERALLMDKVDAEINATKQVKSRIRELQQQKGLIEAGQDDTTLEIQAQAQKSREQAEAAEEKARQVDRQINQFLDSLPPLIKQQV